MFRGGGRFFRTRCILDWVWPRLNFITPINCESEKARVTGLSGGEAISSVYWAVWIQYRSVTDRWPELPCQYHSFAFMNKHGSLITIRNSLKIQPFLLLLTFRLWLKPSSEHSAVSGRTGCHRLDVGELVIPLISVHQIVLFLPEMICNSPTSSLWQPVCPETEQRTAIRQTVPMKQ